MGKWLKQALRVNLFLRLLHFGLVALNEVVVVVSKPLLRGAVWQ